MITPKGYRPLTLKEIQSMQSSELSEVLSVAYERGKFRCKTTGIYDLKITDTTISWSDKDGDPRASIKPILVNLTSDGMWEYGLYKKI